MSEHQASPERTGWWIALIWLGTVVGRVVARLVWPDDEGLRALVNLGLFAIALAATFAVVLRLLKGGPHPRGRTGQRPSSSDGPAV